MALDNLDVRQVFQYLEDFGFFDIVLPFLLVFAITLAVLEKIGLFTKGGATGTTTKGVNIIIALIAAFLFVRNITLIEFVQNLIPTTSMILLVAMMFILIAGIFTGDAKWTGAILAIAVVIAFIALAWSMVYYADTDLGVDIPSFDFTDRDWVIIVFMVAFVLGLLALVGKRPNVGGVRPALEALGRGLGNAGNPNQ